MRRLLHLLLLLFAVIASAPLPACPPPQPATHAHGDHDGQPAQQHDPAQALAGHQCIGCATPLRESAPMASPEGIAILHPLVTVAPLPGHRHALEPPPPKILA